MALQGSGRRTGDDDVELDGLSVVRVEETSCGGRFTGALLCHRRSGGAGKLCRLAGKGGGNGHAIWRYPHALDLDTRNSNHQSKGEDECQQRIGQRERDSAARNLYRKRHAQTQYLHIQVRRAGGNDDLARDASIAQKPSDVGGREHHRCLTVTNVDARATEEQLQRGERDTADPGVHVMELQRADGDLVYCHRHGMHGSTERTDRRGPCAQVDVGPFEASAPAGDVGGHVVGGDTHEWVEETDGYCEHQQCDQCLWPQPLIPRVLAPREALVKSPEASDEAIEER
jgi:hypothetical protein